MSMQIFGTALYVESNMVILVKVNYRCLVPRAISAWHFKAECVHV